MSGLPDLRKAIKRMSGLPDLRMETMRMSVLQDLRRAKNKSGLPDWSVENGNAGAI